jgi:hypothetical protein
LHAHGRQQPYGYIDFDIDTDADIHLHTNSHIYLHTCFHSYFHSYFHSHPHAVPDQSSRYPRPDAHADVPVASAIDGGR